MAQQEGVHAAALPPPSDPEKKTLFLDLDETLIHSQTDPAPARYDFTVRPVICGKAVTFYVCKRPGVDDFLRAAAEAFEVVIFTAGLEQYASLVLDRLDPTGALIAHRLYRSACRDDGDGRLVKDLSATGRAPDCAIIVDDNPNAYSLQPENALPVAPFIDDANDQELEKVMRFLDAAAGFDDTREAIRYYKDLVTEKKAMPIEVNTAHKRGVTGVRICGEEFAATCPELPPGITTEAANICPPVTTGGVGRSGTS
ncbi:putative C-terminal domain small phosphatase [Triticum urartu]|uniref:Putative C-terminal domain small phosphatase n=1 Tax=Triticum urartu TaxID=4572 RepID=M7ZBT1_TRIUA|nr:putative C-terminal domain small phosphatase [Triticum urartu]